jgi:steroid delta-isomerase-like uncharacterized protein
MSTREDRDARVAVVDDHLRAENRGDLDAVMATFGQHARYEDQPWGDCRSGREQVREYYAELLAALPDLAIDVRHRHVSDHAIVLEVEIRGTHLGAWRGLPATGRSVRLPLCGVFTFDDDNRLAGERIYYDRALILRQLGVFREPTTLAGRLAIALLHPATLIRAYVRQAGHSRR